MHISINDVLDSLDDVLGNLLVVAGVLLLFIGLLFMTTFDQWISGLAFFLGVVLLVSGLAIRLEGPLTLAMPSISGFATILICVSLVTIASAGIFVLIATPTGMRFIESVFKGAKTGQVTIIIETAYPFAWLVRPLATIGLGLLVGGILLKIRDIF